MLHVRGLVRGGRLLLASMAVMVAASCAPATTVAPPAGIGTSAPAGIGTSAPASASATAGLAPAGRTEPARVVRVVDGDTIIVDRGWGSERVRYIGIDTPESVKPGTPVEFMAHEAAAANAALVEGQEVVLETDVSETDRFGRLLRYAWLRDGKAWRFVNLELVRDGFAHAASFPPDVHWQGALRDAERSARDAGVGLWGPATPAP